MLPFKRNLLLALSCILILSAIVLEYSPANILYNRLLDQPALTGFQSSLSLNQYNMRNQNDAAVTWQDYSDSPLLLTTGFTNCPYSCPTTMGLYQKLAQQLPASTQFALLTIDPKNDTPAVLADYLRSINPNFIGLYIEDKRELQRAIADLKQSVQHLPAKQDIIHSDFIYLLHPKIEGLIIYNQHNLDEIRQDFIRINQT